VAVVTLALLIVVAAFAGGAFLVLAACVLSGAGLTYLSGLRLSIEERLAYGTLIGVAVMSTLGFLLALAAGLSAVTVLASLLGSLALSGAGWWRGRRLVGEEAGDAVARWARREPWPLWALLAAAWSFTLVLLAHAYVFNDQGLIAGNPAVYADWAAHLTYAGSFAYGANFPPQFPVDPGHPMAYPFLVDFFAAMLVPLGTPLTSALVLTSGLLLLAFPAVMYLAAVRLVGSRGGAALAVLVFALGGGVGFVYFAGDLGRLGLAALQHLPQLYTQIPDGNFVWLNPVLGWLLPQRSVQLGFSLALLTMALLWQASRLEHRAWAPFAFAGTIAGLTPLCHLHAYGTVVALAGFWALFTPRREWLAYFVPALALGVPVVLWMAGAGAASVRVQWWWLANTAGHQDGPVWFWLKNTGLFIPAMAAAFAWRGLLPPRVALHLAPIWLWFLVPNVLVFQPWDWDNTKFFGYWALFGALPVGALLARLLRGGFQPWDWDNSKFFVYWALLGALPVGAPLARLLRGGYEHRVGASPLVSVLGRALAVLAAAVLMLAGGLDLARTLDPGVSSAEFTDAAGLQTAAWARQNTSPSAVFLVAPDHNEPVPTLAGRRVMVGYGGWLWTYGLSDWTTRTDDARRMLAGDPATPALLRRYHVSYVVVGPAEINVFGARLPYWDREGRRVYANDSYTVYRVG
jgi:hypothetical protein